MPDRFVASHIRRIPMFQMLTEEQFGLVVRAFQVLRFEAGQVVVQKGNTTQGFFMVVSGGGVLTDGDKLVARLGEDGALDRGALFHEGVETATFRTTSPTVLLFLSRNRMQTILSYYPEIRGTLGKSDVGTSAAPANTIKPHARSAEVIERSLQRPDETIIMIRRRHPWSFIRRGWMCVLLFIFFTALGVVGFTFSRPLGVGLMATGFILAALLMTYFYFEWRNDSIVITDQRVIQIERVITTLSVTMNEIPIDQIQEVNVDLPPGDLFARIFNYGDVELKNASETGNLLLDMVPGANEIQDAIFANVDRRQQLAEKTRRSAIRAEIEKQIGLTTNNQKAAYVPDEPPRAGDVLPDAPPKSSVATRSFSPAPMHFTNASGDTVIRKHVTIWLAHITAPTLTIIGAFAILAMSIAARSGWVDRLGLPLAVVLFVLGGLWFWWSDWDWRNDMYILGDDKVTLIHKRPLWLQNEVEQVRLARVDNVFSETNGLFDSVFQRGNVKLSLLGEGLEGAKVFYKVHRPHEIQAEISRRQARARSQNARDEQLRQNEAIRDYLSVYHEAVQESNTPDDGRDWDAERVVGGRPDIRPERRHDQSRPAHVPRVQERTRERGAAYRATDDNSQPSRGAEPPMRGAARRDPPPPPNLP